MIQRILIYIQFFMRRKKALGEVCPGGNSFGSGPAVFKTLTTAVDNWGGVTLFHHKTVTIMVDNWGGVTSFPCQIVNTMVDNWGGITSFHCKIVTTIVDNYSY